MYPLFETILIEKNTPCHLFWHQQRINHTFIQMGFVASPPELEKIITIPVWLDPEKKYRLRINYNHSGYELVFTEHTPKSIQTLKLVFSQDISYNLKFADRTSLNTLFQLKGDADDVLIVKNGWLTDTSVANTIFWDGINWITPSDPLLMGTARARLIASGQILEKAIPVQMLNDFPGWNIINALRVFDPGCMFPVSSILK